MAHAINRQVLYFSRGKSHFDHWTRLTSIVTLFRCLFFWDQASLEKILEVILILAQHEFASSNLAHFLKHIDCG